MRRKPLLQNLAWMVKSHVDSPVYLVGTGPLWNDPETHPSALAQWIKERYQHHVEIRVADLCGWHWDSKCVIAHRYILSTQNEWVSMPRWYSINRGNGWRTVTRLSLETADQLNALLLDIAGPFDTRKEAQQYERSRQSYLPAV